MESLDYRFHRISINKHTAIYEEDGSVEVIVSHHDPGHPNWIETCSHYEGTMCWRWYRLEKDAEPIAPETKVVNIQELTEKH